MEVLIVDAKNMYFAVHCVISLGYFCMVPNRISRTRASWIATGHTFARGRKAIGSTLTTLLELHFDDSSVMLHLNLEW